jgi:6-phosphogluconolactonase/glucosamine-6-phosphate isomerase/deaminase
MTAKEDAQGILWKRWRKFFADDGWGSNSKKKSTLELLKQQFFPAEAKKHPHKKDKKNIMLPK